MTRRIGAILGFALLLGGCGTSPSTGSAGVGAQETAPPLTARSAAEAESPAAEATFPSGPAPEGCVRPPPDVTSVIEYVTSEIEQVDPLACYGAADLTFDALVTSPGTFSCPGELQPSWFDCWHLVALNPVPGTSAQPEILLVARNPIRWAPTRSARWPAAPRPAEMSRWPLHAVLHPDIEALRPRVMDTLVRLTGHYDDPAAQDCLYTSYPDPGPPPADEVVDMCRATFVITAMEPLES